MKLTCAEWRCRNAQETIERLRSALQDFTDCVGMTPDRLFEAYFQLHLLRECDFPAPLQHSFNSIISNMTCRADPVSAGLPGRIGDVRNTLNHLNPEEARQIVGSLTRLIEELDVWIQRQT